jgi:hypothetical protein
MSVLFVGCGGHAHKMGEVPASEQNLQAISRAYVSATRRLDRAPESLEDILPELKEIGDSNSFLRSPVDGEPYVIHWGVDYREFGNFPVLAYEKSGEGGERFVSFFRVIKKLKDADFKKAIFPPGKSPPN